MANESLLAQRFAERYCEARAYLLREMEARGLHQRDGWRIVETIRSTTGRMELVMRPIHVRLAAPDDLECVVEIRGDDEVDSHCEPG